MNQEPTTPTGPVRGTFIAAEDAPDWDENGIIQPAANYGADGQPIVAEEEEKKEEQEAGNTEVTDEAEPEDSVEWVAHPGEFKPNDYSFEVTVYDEEGKNGKSQKIASIEDWDKLMESDPNLGSPVALTKAMRLAGKMEIKSEGDKAEYDKKLADYESVAKADEAKASAVESWTKEMEYLVARGDLPKITKTQAEANWSDPEVAKQDGIKEQLELLKFMESENKTRTKAGLKPLSSIVDAFYALERTKSKTTASGTTKTPNDEAKSRQAAGARVGTASQNNAGNVPKGIAVGRGGSLDDLSANWF